MPDNIPVISSPAEAVAVATAKVISLYELYPILKKDLVKNSNRVRLAKARKNELKAAYKAGRYNGQPHTPDEYTQHLYDLNALYSDEGLNQRSKLLRRVQHLMLAAMRGRRFEECERTVRTEDDTFWTQAHIMAKAEIAFGQRLEIDDWEVLVAVRYELPANRDRPAIAGTFLKDFENWIKNPKTVFGTPVVSLDAQT